MTGAFVATEKEGVEMTDKTVLLIDTQTENIDFIREYILKPNGFKALSLSSGENALNVVSTQSVDLLIVDLSVPEMKDFALLKQLRRQEKHLPIIATAAQKSDEDATQAAKSGVRRLIAKPFTIEEMLAAINTVLSETQLSQEQDNLIEKLSQTDRQLSAYERALQRIFTVSQTIAESSDIDSALNSFVEAAAGLSDAEESWLLLLNEAGDLHLRAAWGMTVSLAEDFSIETDESLVGQALRTGEPLIIGGQDEFESFRLAENYFVKSMVNVPLKVKGQSIGVLVVSNKKLAKPIDGDHLRPLTILANFAGLTVATGE